VVEEWGFGLYYKRLKQWPGYVKAGTPNVINLIGARFWKWSWTKVWPDAEV
jgi:hypothetical protein